MILKKENLPWLTTGIVIILFSIMMILQRCSTEKALADLSTQVARYQDTVITRRIVDGDVVSDTKGAELTLDQYQAIDAQRYASFERMLRNNNSQMLATVSLLISRPQVTGDAPVTINPVNKSMTIDMTDSCSLMGNVIVDSTGKATKNIQFRTDSLDLVIANDRDKWWTGREITASSVVRNNCGQITAQKAVIVSPGKKKVHQTNLFKATAVIIIFEAIRFGLTGKF